MKLGLNAHERLASLWDRPKFLAVGGVVPFHQKGVKIEVKEDTFTLPGGYLFRLVQSEAAHIGSSRFRDTPKQAALPGQQALKYWGLLQDFFVPWFDPYNHGYNVLSCLNIQVGYVSTLDVLGPLTSV